MSGIVREPATTIAEVQHLLVTAGARQISTITGADHTGLQFVLDTPVGHRRYLLRVDTAAAVDALTAAHDTGRLRTTTRARLGSVDHATTVAWLLLRKWLAAGIGLVNAGQTTLDRLLLPFLVAADGTSLYDSWRRQTLYAIAPTDPNGDPI